MDTRNLMIVQGGGPTAVFNASLASAIEQARRPAGFVKVYGARSGALGLARGEVVDLTAMSAEELRVLRETPGAALGSSRVAPREAEMRREVETLRRLNVRDVLFLGGNGTMRGAGLFGGFCAAEGFEVQIVGVPKTVDNDLAGTDRSPGYASAARYVAQSTQELGLDVRSLPQPVAIFETMGRSVGWLAAAAALAQAGVGDAPQLIYVPEIAFEEEAFLEAVNANVRRAGWAVVVVAEGIRKQDGSMVYEQRDPSQQDALGRSQTGGVARHLAGVVAERLKVRCRSEKPGLLGRASRAHRSQQDFEDAMTVGAAGVRALLAGETGTMVALLPLGDLRQTQSVDFAEVAGVERPIPPEWLSDGPLAVTEAFRSYLAPLVGELHRYAPEFAREGR